MTTHYLKTWIDSFVLSANGVKPFEIRENDRQFQAGDVVVLQEFDRFMETYTGRELVAEILSVVEGYGLPDGLCVIGLGKITQK